MLSFESKGGLSCLAEAAAVYRISHPLFYEMQKPRFHAPTFRYLSAPLTLSKTVKQNKTKATNQISNKSKEILGGKNALKMQSKGDPAQVPSNR